MKKIKVLILAVAFFLALAGAVQAQTSTGYELTFRALTADSISVTQYENEQFNVNYDIRNPGSRTFEGSLSAFLTDNAGNVIATIGTRASTLFGAGSGRSSFVTCSVPATVSPGLYQIRIAVSAAGSERQFITNSVNSAPTSVSFRVTVNNNVVVAPLIQTQWSPYAPFNNLFPANPEIRWHDSNSGRIHADCGNTALAQIMYYYRYPARGTGQSNLLMVQNVAVPTVNLNVAYDWDNMLKSYPNATSGTERQRSAVSTLFYQIAAANGANGITYPGSYFASMTINFGYDRSIQWHERRFYNNVEWEALIKSQLDAGMPVYYWGHSQESLSRGVVNSHAFIIDGYDNQGRFHMNIGNNGQSDGWYSLYNIGNRGWWPDEQHIIINIKPDAGGVSDNNRFGLNSFSASKTSVSQNELFTVNISLRSFSIFPGGQRGAALVDNSGKIVDIINIENYNPINPRLSRTSTINCFVPSTVRPGQYRLMIVTRPAGGEWKIVADSDKEAGTPNAVLVTVTAGAANSGGYGLAFASLNADNGIVSASRGTQFNVNYNIRNPGTELFEGSLRAVLIDNAGNETVIGTRASTSFGAGSGRSSFVSCTIPNSIALGNYQLKIAVRPAGGEWRIITMSFDNAPNSINFTVR